MCLLHLCHEALHLIGGAAYDDDARALMEAGSRDAFAYTGGATADEDYLSLQAEVHLAGNPFSGISNGM